MCTLTTMIHSCSLLKSQSQQAKVEPQILIWTLVPLGTKSHNWELKDIFWWMQMVTSAACVDFRHLRI